MDIGARRDRRPLIAFLERLREQKTEKVYSSRRERFPTPGAQLPNHDVYSLTFLFNSLY